MMSKAPLWTGPHTDHLRRKLGAEAWLLESIFGEEAPTASELAADMQSLSAAVATSAVVGTLAKKGEK